MVNNNPAQHFRALGARGRERLIVEFAVENRAKVKLREGKLEKARLRAVRQQQHRERAKEAAAEATEAAAELAQQREETETSGLAAESKVSVAKPSGVDGPRVQTMATKQKRERGATKRGKRGADGGSINLNLRNESARSVLGRAIANIGAQTAASKAQRKRKRELDDTKTTAEGQAADDEARKRRRRADRERERKSRNKQGKRRNRKEVAEELKLDNLVAQYKKKFVGKSAGQAGRGERSSAAARWFS
jgi:hypothetical protein